MSELTVEVLEMIIKNMPKNYVVEFDNGKSSMVVADKVEIDVGLQRLILKKY